MTINQNEKTVNQSNNKTSIEQKVQLRRSFMQKFGTVLGGTSPQCSPQNTPQWFDRNAFTHAQHLYKTYGAFISFSQLYGLLFTLHFFDGLAVLLATGQSATVPQLFSRYLSTLVHVRHWFTSDPFDVNSRAYRSLKVVRALHRQVARRMNDRLPGGPPPPLPPPPPPIAQRNDHCELPGKSLWLSQWSMMHAQFTFVGFGTLFPEALGLGALSRYDHHCLFHFWRVIGHCLGIEDRFNLCEGNSDEEVVELCRQIFHLDWKPIIEGGRSERVGQAMAEGIALGIYRFVPVVTYRSLMHYAALHFDGLIDGNKEAYRLNSTAERVYFCLLSWTLRAIPRWPVLCWALSRLVIFLQKLAIWWRKFHVATLAWRYPSASGSRYSYHGDSRCPFIISDVNYRTAWEHRLT